MSNVSVVIPTYQASSFLPALLSQLRRQSLPPLEIIVIDSSSTDGTVEIALQHTCRVEVIPKASFNHGATRNQGALLARGDILVFMTQDALPVDERFLEELTRPLRDGEAVAAYGRQIAYPNAFPPEVFARNHNYPPTSHLRAHSDVDQTGIKAFFFSNVASCVDVEAFRMVGGFPEGVILNEDMLLCANLMLSGGVVAYQASGKVFHSHNYSLAQQFRRYFDIGVAMSNADGVLKNARAGGEGLKFALKQCAYLLRTGALAWIPRTIVEIGLKFLAFQLGKRERFLSNSIKKTLSMHSYYWD